MEPKVCLSVSYDRHHSHHTLKYSLNIRFWGHKILKCECKLISACLTCLPYWINSYLPSHHWSKHIWWQPRFRPIVCLKGLSTSKDHLNARTALAGCSDHPFSTFSCSSKSIWYSFEPIFIIIDKIHLLWIQFRKKNQLNGESSKPLAD